MFQILEAMAKKLESGQAVPAEHMSMVLEFSQIFIDKCHHGKEESILFPAIQEAEITGEIIALEVLLAEHASSRDYIKKLNHEVLLYESSGLKDTANIVKYAN